MSITDAERLELYELAKRQLGDRFAKLMIRAVPPDPDRLATKEDLAVGFGALRTEMADLRTELKTDMAGLRTEMADLRTELKTEMRDLTVHQTRTMMLGLVGSVTALSITQLVLGVVN